MAPFHNKPNPCSSMDLTRPDSLKPTSEFGNAGALTSREILRSDAKNLSSIAFPDDLNVDVYETTPEWEDVIGLNGFLIGKDPKKLYRRDLEKLQFRSSDEAFEFHRAYAHLIGFSAKTGSSRVDKDSREMVIKEFSCNKAGSRLAKWMK
ncbi:hypothetical protein COLO4_20917 [Corchorus olitorius]|uniref:FAR1 domain-containing protein n=1 Tax=Corchorus olitorius TaxID=93759 RepID=A0A1R3IW70_9ROSI|nr:hypothetical protein COLO4_20917 [Corchorus olitorius]